MRPTIPDVMPYLVSYLRRPGNIEGGSLHIYAADGNDGPGVLESCAEYARESGDRMGERLATVIAGMSRTQRRKLARRAMDDTRRAGEMRVRPWVELPPGRAPRDTVPEELRLVGSHWGMG